MSSNFRITIHSLSRAVGCSLVLVVAASACSAPGDASRGTSDDSRASRRVEAIASKPRSSVPIEGLPSYGASDAKVTLVELTDYECGFCARADATVTALLAAHPNDLRVVVAPMALPMHPHARDVATFALGTAAHVQGESFASLHHVLFSSSPDRSFASLTSTAEKLGLRAPSIGELAAADATFDRVATTAERLAVHGTPTFFVNGVRLVGAQPLATFEATFAEELAHANALLASGAAPNGVYAAILDEAKVHPAPNPALDDPGAPSERLAEAEGLDGSTLVGPTRAAHRIVVFTDLECPFCRRHDAAMRALATERGDVEIAIRHAPLAMHPHAVEGAKAAIAAERQGKLEPFMRAAFANEGPLDEAAIARCARAAGLDSAAFAADRSSAATEARLAEDRALATKLGVEGTPTSFVDGRRVRGAQTRTTFEHALDARS